MITGINSEDRLVQQTFADHLRKCLDWESVYAYNTEVFGTPPPSPAATRHPLPLGEGRGEGVCDLGRTHEREIILTRDLRVAIQKLNPELPPTAVEDVVQTLTTYDSSRSTLQHNREFYRLIRDGVPVTWRGANGEECNKKAHIIDFRNPGNNRFLAVRELKIQGLRTPHYNRRADLSQTEKHLLDRGFDVARLRGARGFDRIEALRDATDALYASDETKRRFEIMAREVFSRFKALIAEPAVYAYAERHDNIEAIYRKLQENRNTADVTEVLKELHKIVNAAIRAQGPGGDQAEGLTVDLSKIDFAKLRDEFAKRARRKCEVLADIRQVVEQRLAAMLAQNPQRMDYYAKYLEIVAAYNREKDRATVEQTFADLLDFAAKLDAEQKRAVQEGLSEDELAFFDLLQNDKLNKTARERVKQASRQLLTSLTKILVPMQQWTAKARTQAEVKTLILDQLYEALPTPPFTEQETDAAAARIYDYVWQRSAAGQGFGQPT